MPKSNSIFLGCGVSPRDLAFSPTWVDAMQVGPCDLADLSNFAGYVVLVHITTLVRMWVLKLWYDGSDRKMSDCVNSGISNLIFTIIIVWQNTSFASTK